jgi:hypothetical protein
LTKLSKKPRKFNNQSERFRALWQRAAASHQYAALQAAAASARMTCGD